MKTILITGGSDGLGKALAQELAKDNKVVIIATNEERLKEAAKELNCEHFVCDISDHKQVEETINKIIAKFGTIDILINNAGILVQGELEFNSCEEIQRLVEVNLLGTMFITKACVPIMKKNKGGLIININSRAGLGYKAESTVYNASKWGMTGFSGSLQEELNKYGIRITDIFSGRMKTNMFKKINIEKDMLKAIDTKEVVRLIKFIIETPNDVVIPQVGIKNINN